MSNLNEDALSKAIKTMAQAALLSTGLPLSVKKRIVYELLNDLGVKLNKDELKELEDLYKEIPLPPFNLPANSTSPPVSLSIEKGELEEKKGKARFHKVRE